MTVIDDMAVVSADVFHFEGPEKKLDVRFDLQRSADGVPGGFRRLAQATWTKVLTDAKCAILHRVSNASFDAYLLSESSLFVYADRVIAKTCGQTTLLALVPHLCALGKVLGLEPAEITYGHYRYKFPDEQFEPHRSFASERARLDELFPGGRAVTLAGGDGAEGFTTSKIAAAAEDPYHVSATAATDYKVRDADQGSPRCWHVCAIDVRGMTLQGVEEEELASAAALAEAAELLAAPHEPSAELVMAAAGQRADGPAGARANADAVAAPAAAAAGPETEMVIEVAMEGLSPEFTRHFFYDGEEGAARAADPPAVAKACGLQGLMHGVHLDSWCFEPCGFSLNGLEDGYYFTIHITPEPQMSFASFETNHPAYVSAAFTERLLKVFAPQDATVLVMSRSFRSHASPAADADAMPLAPVAAPSIVRGFECVRETTEQLMPSVGASCVVLSAHGDDMHKIAVA